MTSAREEAREYAIRRAVYQYADEWAFRQIVAAVNHFGSAQVAVKHMSPDLSFQLGNFGVTGPGLSYVSCLGNAKTHDISVWLPENRRWDAEPDLVVTWVEVYQWVSERAGVGQLSMF